jgi:hypothetical protein
MRLPTFLFTIFPLTASAQMFTFGVQGGIPAQTPLGRTSQTPFALGPSVDVHIFSGLSLETGLLYSRIGQRSDNYAFLGPGANFTTVGAVTLGFVNAKGYALEVPLLAKYRFVNSRHTWRPFVTAGPTIRRTSLTYDEFNTAISIPTGSAENTVGGVHSRRSVWKADPAAGIGVDVRAGRYHLEPEVRYSYWGVGETSLVRKNQVHFLMGFRF